jgi:hypothetical protein
VINYSLFTRNFGSAQTAFHQLSLGSSVASDNIVLLTLLANQ